MGALSANVVAAFITFSGATFILIPGLDLIAVLILSQAVNGMLLPFLLIFMVRIVNYRRIRGRCVNHRVTNWFVWVTIVIVIGLTMAMFGLQTAERLKLL